MKLPSRRRGALLALPLIAMLGAAVAQAQDNIVPIEVRQRHDGDVNMGFVDVTVCNAARQCRTVPDVLVDTGSSGLRLFRGALDGLQLDAVRDAEGRMLANASTFGLGGLWGTLHLAQVGLGKVTTSGAIPIQLYDHPWPLERLPAEYRKVDARSSFVAMSNGILGISPRRSHAYGYYAFSAAGGDASDSDWVPVAVDATRELANPIGHFPAPYDNGSVIKMPKVDWHGGHKQLLGWLGLGIGQPTEALFPQSKRRIAHELDESGLFAAKLGGRRIDVLVDCGTTGVVLDLEHLDLERLGVTSPHGQERLYDAAPLTPLALTVSSGGRDIELARPLYVGPLADALKKASGGYGVLPALVAKRASEAAPQVLGMPFFYGRTVATGLAGTVNPFAQGRAVNSKPVAAAPLGGPLGVHIIDDHVDRLMSIEDDEDDEDIEIINDEVQIGGGTKLIDDYVKPAQAPAPVVEDDPVAYSVSPNGYIVYTDSSL